jgi:esterase/lipase
VVRKLIRVVISCAVLVAPARGETVGIVMMHGKNGTPAQLHQLADTVTDAGFVVERPEMCWSAARIYDQTYLECLADVDAAAARLKERGANAIVVLGMSLGGNAALGFGARRQGLEAIVALAPAPPESLRRRPEIAQSIARAQAAIAAGRGDEKTTFDDVNVGRLFTVSTTATIYLSFFGLDSPAVMPVNAAHLTAPLLIVSGDNDPTQSNVASIFARVPSDPRNKRVTVEADHLGTPKASTATVLAWLKVLTK